MKYVCEKTVVFHLSLLSAIERRWPILPFVVRSPWAEKVAEEAARVDKRIHLLAGGFHLVTSAEAEIEKVALNLRERWKVHSVVPGHCTGERGILTLQKLFGKRYVYAGIGEVIPLP